MKNLLKKLRNRIDSGNIFKRSRILNPARNPAQNPINNQEGSIILIALMVMVIMTVIGLVSSDKVITENFIIRNEGIYKQNVSMVEGAMMQLFQLFWQIPPESETIVRPAESSLAWVKSMNDTWADTDWYVLDSSNQILNNSNSMAITAGHNLIDRGETASGNLRCGLVGWKIVEFAGGGSESIGVGANETMWREGRLISEYASRAAGGADHGYGMLRMEMGIKRRIVSN